MKITESELLEALSKARAGTDGERPDGYLTTWEVAEAMKRSIPTAGRLIRKLYRAGQLDCVMIQQPTMDGRMMPAPAYRLKT